MSELTKRKAFTLEAPGSGGGTESDSGGSSSANTLLSEKDGDVRVVEYDVRPSCANDAPVRYIQRGEHLTPLVKGVPVDHSLRVRLAGCFSISGLTRELKEMFLPAGYPDSVSEDYLTFQFWDTIQAVCSYLRGVLATQSVLQSVGVGDDKATPLAAALQWVLRDGSGMIGGLTFAYLVGPKFDVNVKRWRLFADVINDVGLTLDMLAPLFPSTLVTHVLCVSSVCKTMCGVAAGATRSSLMTHFAKRDNMADCAAKEGSQETAVKLFGLVFGMYFANAVNSSPRAIWCAFLALTLVHVFANYNAVSGLCIPTVNQQRGLILIQRFLTTGKSGSGVVGGGSAGTGGDAADATMKAELSTAERADHFSIRSVNRTEPIYYDSTLPLRNIVMGSQIGHARLSSHDLDALLQLYADERYLLSVDGDRVHVLFYTDVKPTDELRAFYQAVVVLEALETFKTHATHTTTTAPAVASPTAKRTATASSGSTGVLLQHGDIVEAAYARMCADFAFFYQQLQTSGWRTHMFLLQTSSWRIKLSDDV